MLSPAAPCPCTRRRWQEVWATKRELTELPKIIAKEAQLNQTLDELNKETKDIKSSLTTSVSEFIKEVNQPITLSEESPEENKIEEKKVDTKEE